MNILSIREKAEILRQLVEGCSIRSIERMTHHHRDTIVRVLLEAGEKAKAVMDSRIQRVPAGCVQIDELWCYVGKKDAQLTEQEKGRADIGSQYVFVALDPDTKLIPCFRLGKRTYENTLGLICDLHFRMSGRLHLTTDSFTSYPGAIFKTFGLRVDYAQLIKVYTGLGSAKVDGYSPIDFVTTRKKAMIGKPNMSRVSTSHVERGNLTLRMCLRRLTRLTNGFSKKRENLEAALYLHFAYYNFVRVHLTLGTTPAMAAKITDEVWTFEDILMYDESRVAVA
jgi:IS1 family transposase